jgi:hypothetical protein
MKHLGSTARAAATLGAALALAIPSQADAQFTRFVQLCNNSLQTCANFGLGLTGSTLSVGVVNLGPTASLITGFGLFGGGLTGGTLTGQSYVGSPALATGFATSGAPSDLQQGAGTQVTPVGADFGSNGFLTCAQGDAITGGFQRLATCPGEYGLFTFSVVGTSLNLANIGIGVRVQAIGQQGLSDKCFSSGDADCTSTPTTGIGGGGAGSVVPEPSTYVLLASGLLGLAGVARRRQRQS